MFSTCKHFTLLSPLHFSLISAAIVMLRVLRRLTRPTSSPTGRNISKYNVLNNGKAAASRLVNIGYQTHDMSSTSTLQLCTLNNYHTVGTKSSSLLPLNSDCFDVPTTSICHRSFSSADAETLNQVRESHLNT